MGRVGTCLGLLLLLLPCGCGEGPVEDAFLLTAEAAPETKPSGPVLAGRATRRAPRRVGPVRVDEHARLHIPDGTTWNDMLPALLESQRLRREREGDLEGATCTCPEEGDDGAMLVDIPGVPGYVIIGGTRTPGLPGLDLHLKANPARTTIEAVGTRWVSELGCDTETEWSADGWSLDLWQEALDALAALKGHGEHPIQVRAHPDVPTEDVLRFLVASAERKFGAPHIDTSRRRRFDVAPEGALAWLAAHQTRKGVWDEEVALGLCKGETMRATPPPWDPAQADDVGLTGLSLCAFLGAGYTNRGKHPFARTVSRACRQLKSRQQPDGRFVGGRLGDDAVIHGFAALAMLEAYAMTGSPIFKGSAQRGLDALGPVWRASRDDRLPTLLTAMVIKSAELVNEDAVKRGKTAPLTTDAELRAAVLRRARRLDDHGTDLEVACKQMTLIFLDADPMKDAALLAAVDRLSVRIAADPARVDPVTFWVSTLACFQVGRRPWKRMRDAMDAAVHESQAKGGHVCCLRGSWAGDEVRAIYGDRVAATALRSMCLQVFYRYDRVFGVRGGR